MGLFKELLLLPMAPVRGAMAVPDLVRREAEREFYNPAIIRQQLDDVDRRRRDGELSDNEADLIEQELIDRLLEGMQHRNW